MFIVKQSNVIIGITDSKEAADHVIYNSILEYVLNTPELEFTFELKKLAIEKQIETILKFSKSYEITECNNMVQSKESVINYYNELINTLDVRSIIK